ncbi:hypothetical protein [Flavobacterium kingsejongi]|uniref:Uncharacterized protein n=1 Tax=Flavobacterium kingsejongi TaxID=1678728 RepID=A0A2S1LQU7_9FLAO|nr:hypothetical protein [Flavobacterium kingsejongi]AWG26031.1 hypothetical protein FK004_12745 [Flavobacterium kingsejongi]
MLYKIGEKISVDLSEYLKEHTNEADRATVANQHNYGPSILNAVIKRNRNVTSENCPMLNDVMKIAIQTRNHKKQYFDKTHRQILKEVEA